MKKLLYAQSDWSFCKSSTKEAYSKKLLPRNFLFVAKNKRFKMDPDPVETNYYYLSS